MGIEEKVLSMYGHGQSQRNIPKIHCLTVRDFMPTKVALGP